MVSPGRAGLAAERARVRLNVSRRVPGAESLPLGAAWYSEADADEEKQKAGALGEDVRKRG